MARRLARTIAALAVVGFGAAVPASITAASTTDPVADLDLTDGAVGGNTARASVDLGSATVDLMVPNGELAGAGLHPVCGATTCSPSGGNQTGGAADSLTAGLTAALPLLVTAAGLVTTGCVTRRVRSMPTPT